MNRFEGFMDSAVRAYTDKFIIGAAKGINAVGDWNLNPLAATVKQVQDKLPSEFELGAPVTGTQFSEEAGRLYRRSDLSKVFNIFRGRRANDGIFTPEEHAGFVLVNGRKDYKVKIKT